MRLVKSHLLWRAIDGFRAEFSRQFAVVLAQVLEQGGRYRKPIAAGQGLDLTNVAKRGPHHGGLDTVRPVVGVDLADRLHTRISVGCVRAATRLDVPIEDASDKRGNEKDAGVGTSRRLAKRKHQSQIAVDALSLKHLGGLDTLPGGSDLDQDMLASDATRGIGGDDRAGLRDRCGRIEREVGIDFRRDASRNDPGKLAPERDGETVANRRDRCLRIAGLTASPRDRLVHEVSIDRVFDRLEQQGRVRGAVLRLQSPYRLDVTRIRDDDGHLTELCKLRSLLPLSFAYRISHSATAHVAFATSCFRHEIPGRRDHIVRRDDMCAIHCYDLGSWSSSSSSAVGHEGVAMPKTSARRPSASREFRGRVALVG